MNGSMPAVLIAGVGNIFLGDDGFGCEVLRELAQQPRIQDAVAVDFGIRGIDLAYALLEPYEAVIIVDAIASGGTPGSLYVLQPVTPKGRMEDKTSFDAHSMEPLHLLALARSLGEIRAEIYIVGCEPLDLGDPYEGRMGLSDVVKASVPEAVRAVNEFADRIRAREPRVALCEAI